MNSSSAFDIFIYSILQETFGNDVYEIRDFIHEI